MISVKNQSLLMMSTVKSEHCEEVKPEQMDKEAKLSSVSGVDGDSKKDVLPKLNLEGTANFTISINMAM